jgi:hypothetical protein
VKLGNWHTVWYQNQHDTWMIYKYLQVIYHREIMWYNMV